MSEALAAISLATDLATGVGFEKGLRVCALATAFSEALELPLEEQRTVHLAALLRSVGCTSHAPENADDFADDIAFEAALRTLDVGDRTTPTAGRKLVVLTERGVRAQQTAREILADSEHDWSRLLGRRDFATLRGLLVRLHDGLWPP